MSRFNNYFCFHSVFRLQLIPANLKNRLLAKHLFRRYLPTSLRHQRHHQIKRRYPHNKHLPLTPSIRTFTAKSAKFRSTPANRRNSITRLYSNFVVCNFLLNKLKMNNSKNQIFGAILNKLCDVTLMKF